MFYIYTAVSASHAPPINQNLPKTMQSSYPLLTKYYSLNDFLQTMVPLLMMEIWEMVRPFANASLNGLFTLAETDSETDSEMDSKPNGYIVLCRIFHIAQT